LIVKWNEKAACLGGFGGGDFTKAKHYYLSNNMLVLLLNLSTKMR
jgi:hypothetical protein